VARLKEFGAATTHKLQRHKTSAAVTELPVALIAQGMFDGPPVG
jgi:hypothetical protein